MSAKEAECKGLRGHLDRKGLLGLLGLKVTREIPEQKAQKVTREQTVSRLRHNGMTSLPVWMHWKEEGVDPPSFSFEGGGNDAIHHSGILHRRI